ncbi:hypothetical protein KSD_62000 [Ktedonobacter sp. SOSP1-85]|uniref:hypothetical protein n=1 Tax=Ktedonobacter sp. SOSP1-85 TaxID=2778367 RepID=UPI0019155918|nr:hypothetical protein [Ktedonobacter sp. SOSP1-85]GHO78429.1 hypothetical protein KSD_62000 [Ktedonobacter sp. SOSP1-85]
MTTTPQTFAQRIGLFNPCVAPATILSDDPLQMEEDGLTPLTLRQEASHDGLCHLRVLRCLSCGDLYQAEVAATPQLLHTHPIKVFIAEEQLRYAAPWDKRLDGADPDSILARLEARAAANQPTIRIEPEEQKKPFTPEPAVALQRLDLPVEVTQERLQEAFKAVMAGTPTEAHTLQKLREVSTRSIGAFHMQQAFLCAAIDTLMDRLYRSTEQVNHLAVKTNCALIAQVQRWHRDARQRVVNAIPYFNKREQRHSWRLLIGVPEHLLQAA